MEATLVLRLKKIVEGGYIVEIVVWSVPESVKGSQHLYKYRLFFGTEDRRIVGYDNERGKGDHRHYEGIQNAYIFRDVRSLLSDFEKDMDQWLARRQEH